MKREIAGILNNIEQAKQDIRERADYEKTKPWIAPRFDAQIDKYAHQELKRLSAIESELRPVMELADAAEIAEELESLLSDITTRILIYKDFVIKQW